MNIVYIGFIVASSFLHAFYNFLMRKMRGSQLYLSSIFFIAALISFLALIITRGYRDLNWAAMPYIYGASFFYVLYQIFVNIAYQKGENISTCYPLTVLSPLFIPIWAFFLLGERISVLTGIGIITAVFGAVAIQMKSISVQEVVAIFKFDRAHSGPRYAFAASFVYSFGAILDKYSVAALPLTTYLFFLIGLMSLNMLVYMACTRQNRVLEYIRDKWRNVLVGGVALFFSFLFFRQALQHIAVSVAVPLRQFSIVFAVLLGVVFLKEKLNTEKSVAIIIIVFGLVLINLGL